VNNETTNIPRSPKGKTWKALLVAIIIIAIISAGLWYWRANRLNNAGGWNGGGPIDVVTTKLLPQTAPLNIETIGEVRAINQVTLSSQQPGRVSDIYFDSGDHVEAGSLLIQLDDAPEQADLQAANAATKFAKYQLERAQNLVKIDAVSDEVLQQRQAEFDRLSAQVEQIKARIGQLRVIAPFSGELGLREVDLGQYVNPGEMLVTLTSLNKVYVNFDAPQQELNRIDIGQPITVYSETTNKAGLNAEISAIERQVNRNTRNVTFQAELKNTDQQLHPGMYVTVDINVASQEDALLLPKTAIITSSNGNSAIVVRNISNDGIGTADIVPVEIERYIDENVLISKGLEANDVIVTTGQLRVRPGAQLRVSPPSTQSSKLLK